jgi:hypothetical protein
LGSFIPAPFRSDQKARKKLKAIIFFWMMASGSISSGLHHPLAPGVTATPVIIKITSRMSTRNSSARNQGTGFHDDNDA